MQRNLRKIAVGIAMIVGLLGVAGLMVRGCFRCDYIREAPVWSSDGKWVVSSFTRACPAGLVTIYDVFVTLSPRPGTVSPAAGPVQIFENDGAAEPVNISWTSSSKVILKVTEFGTVRTSKHEGGNVKFEYEVPKRLWDSLDASETARLQNDRDAQELFKAGKISGDDLRLELGNSQKIAEQVSKFRQWILNNATVETGAATDPSR